MAQIDPYATTNALAEGYNFMQGIAQDRARRQAGNALASGNVNQAMSALGGVGDLQSVADLQSGQQEQAAAAAAAEEEDRKQRLSFIGQAAEAIMQAPPDRREEVWMELRPVFQQMGFPDDLLMQLDRAPKTDDNLRSVAVAAGREVESPFANDVTVGGARLRPDRYTGEYTPAYEAPFDPFEGAGSGYMWTDATRTRQTFIPGGQADPSVVGQRAAAGRAPPRPRASGGGSRSGGTRGATSTQRPQSSGRYEYF